MKTVCVGICSLLAFHSASSQVKDTIAKKEIQHLKAFRYTSFIVPTLAIGYGFSTFTNHGSKSVNYEIKEEVWLETPHTKTTLDDYLQWVPAVAVYGLNLSGIHGRNNFRDRTILYGMSQLCMLVTVTSLKHITHQLRPDKSDYYSFPSGHTANAFTNAEFMWQEYKDVSPWLGASGYLAAVATGYLRMYNNKHWLSDVVAGAGIGIVSTKLAYWLYPKIKHVLFRDKLTGTQIMPVFQNDTYGIALIRQF